MESNTNSTAQALTTIGIDIGKEVFHIVGFDADGKIALRRECALKRSARPPFPDVIGTLAVWLREGGDFLEVAGRKD
jgi:predicted NBD/HSP70 family sugar kinase